MARPLRIDSEENMYHVASRGWELRGTVRDSRDRQGWLELLDRVATRCRSVARAESRRRAARA